MLVTACEPLCHFAADPRTDEPDAGLWWLAQIQPLRETRVAHKLIAADVACYLPRGVFHKARPDGRKWTRTSPLFPGYLFLRSDPPLHRAVADAREILVVRRIEDQVRFVRELRSLDTLARSSVEVVLGPAIVTGSRVRVTHGVLAGTVGLVARLGPRSRIYVELSVMGQTVSTELEHAQVELVTTP
jgi:transcription antitermination factor NusG